MSLSRKDVLPLGLGPGGRRSKTEAQHPGMRAGRRSVVDAAAASEPVESLEQRRAGIGVERIGRRHLGVDASRRGHRVLAAAIDSGKRTPLWWGTGGCCVGVPPGV